MSSRSPRTTVNCAIAPGATPAALVLFRGAGPTVVCHPQALGVGRHLYVVRAASDRNDRELLERDHVDDGNRTAALVGNEDLAAIANVLAATSPNPNVMPAVNDLKLMT